MLQFTFTQFIIATIVVFFYLFFLIDRICKCVEYCSLARAYGNFAKAGAKIKMEDLDKNIERDT